MCPREGQASKACGEVACDRVACAEVRSKPQERRRAGQCETTPSSRKATRPSETLYREATQRCGRMEGRKQMKKREEQRRRGRRRRKWKKKRREKK
jgi:hypothetical protein